MLKKFKDLQIGDRCYVRNQHGEFLKIQIVKKAGLMTHFGYVKFLPLYDLFPVRYQLLIAKPDKLISVYSHATLLSNAPANPL